jgi:hypothetical protein
LSSFWVQVCKIQIKKVIQFLKLSLILEKEMLCSDISLSEQKLKSLRLLDFIKVLIF